MTAISKRLNVTEIRWGMTRSGLHDNHTDIIAIKINPLQDNSFPAFHIENPNIELTDPKSVQDRAQRDAVDKGGVVMRSIAIKFCKEVWIHKFTNAADGPAALMGEIVERISRTIT
jgi:hypothetical protein